MKTPVAVILRNPIYRIEALTALKRSALPFRLVAEGMGAGELRLLMEKEGVGTIISESGFLDEVDAALWAVKGLDNYILLDRYDPRRSNKEAAEKEVWDFFARQEAEALNDYGWNSSFTNEPFTIAEMEQYVDNFRTKLRPYLKPDSRVLDIGCGHGLVLFEIAKDVRYYLATDPVGEILRKNEIKVKDRGWSHIECKELAASELDCLSGRDFDIIVCNSAVQYFPNSLYLERVIRHCIDAMAEVGVIYLDDLLDADKRDELIGSMNEYKAGNPDVRVKTNWEDDLFVSKAFFHDLQKKYPCIVRLEMTRKLGAIENELTRWRYDALLEIDKRAGTRPSAPAKGRYDLGAIWPERIGDVYSMPRTSMEDDVIAGLKKEMDDVAASGFSFAGTAMDDLCYVIYTSGSTGDPKGVMIEHSGMMNHIYAKIGSLDINGDSVIAQNAAHTFDISVWQAFSAIVTGGKTVIYPDEMVLQPDLLVKAIIRDQVSMFELVPSYLTIFLAECHSPLPDLRFLLVTGEEVPSEVIVKWFEKNPSIPVVNAYGPTEASDDITHHLLTSGMVSDRIPVGKPLQNLSIYIVGNDERLCPIGVKGEVWVSGVGVGRGYLNDAGKTHEAFIPDRFTGNGQSRIYKTGDIGRWLPDGSIELSGRKDWQVKIRGYRIELSEIEHYLLQIRGIREAVVITQAEGQDTYLLAFFTASGMISVSEIKTALADRLPAYMVPSYLIQLDRLPLSSNGKIDRKALKKDWDPRKRCNSSMR
jgi:amino acid adenylation domain-containing protein